MIKVSSTAHKVTECGAAEKIYAHRHDQRMNDTRQHPPTTQHEHPPATTHRTQPTYLHRNTRQGLQYTVEEVLAGLHELPPVSLQIRHTPIVLALLSLHASCPSSAREKGCAGRRRKQTLGIDLVQASSLAPAFLLYLCNQGG